MLYPDASTMDALFTDNRIATPDRARLNAAFVVERSRWLDDLLDRYFYLRVLDPSPPIGAAHLHEKQIMNELARLVFADARAPKAMPRAMGIDDLCERTLRFASLLRRQVVQSSWYARPKRRPAAVACLAAFIACSPPASKARESRIENPKVQPAASHRVADDELVDTDHDDVPDVCDWCPREPGINRVEHPFGRGCPYVDCFGGSDDISISFARNQTDPPAQLDDIAHQLDVSSPIVIVGHASGGEKDPEHLAEERAQKVMNRLVSAGIDAKQLEAHGAGADASTNGPGAWRVDLVPTRWCQRTRAWDPSSRDVRAAPRGELTSCPQRLRL